MIYGCHGFRFIGSSFETSFKLSRFGNPHIPHVSIVINSCLLVYIVSVKKLTTSILRPLTESIKKSIDLYARGRLERVQLVREKSHKIEKENKANWERYTHNTSNALSTESSELITG